ncbi:MAG: site-specific DNA-methyltransferase [Clostridiales Family XIII bacterium]|nr:site-specific DNA-methyltransferase [Clostridiales Family XIII bacterium]
MDSYEGALSGRVSEPGRVITGDNLRVAKTMLAAVRAGIQDAPTLIYMDPPFFTKEKYGQKIKLPGTSCGDIKLPVHAFSDMWGDTYSSDGARGDKALARYLTMLAERITAARDLLADNGSLWIHLDHHAAHYVKILADHIFGGTEYLMNEVIWHYSSGGATKKHFARKHDTLLFYAKDPKLHVFYPMLEKSYNRDCRPYNFKGVKEYCDEGGWYTLVNMRDVWRIDMVGRTSGERTGYATQKPEALIDRIVASCTAPGDLCLDMFGGSGTLAAVCERAGRRWVTIDSSPLASLHTERRMVGLGAAFEILCGRCTVADNLPESGRDAPSWELDVRVERTPGTGAALVTIMPSSYTIPEIALGVDMPQVAALIGMAQDTPECFMAGMSAGLLGGEGDAHISGYGIIGGLGGEHPCESGDDPFRPQHTAYGKDCLRLLIRRSGKVTIRVRVTDIFGSSGMLDIEAEV